MLSSASTFDQDSKLPVSSLGAWPHHLLWISERNTQCLQGRSLGSPGDNEPQCKIAGRMLSLPSAVSQGKSFLRHRSGGCLSAYQVVSAMFGIRVAEPASSQSEEGKLQSLGLRERGSVQPPAGTPSVNRAHANEVGRMYDGGDGAGGKYRRKRREGGEGLMADVSKVMGRAALGLTWGREGTIGILGARLVRFLCPSGIRAVRT